MCDCNYIIWAIDSIQRLNHLLEEDLIDNSLAKKRYIDHKNNLWKVMKTVETDFPIAETMDHVRNEEFNEAKEAIQSCPNLSSPPAYKNID